MLRESNNIHAHTKSFRENVARGNQSKSQHLLSKVSKKSPALEINHPVPTIVPSTPAPQLKVPSKKNRKAVNTKQSFRKVGKFADGDNKSQTRAHSAKQNSKRVSQAPLRTKATTVSMDNNESAKPTDIPEEKEIGEDPTTSADGLTQRTESPHGSKTCIT